MRGEDKDSADARLLGVETPPRAWGRLSGPNVGVHGSGNTPTCVGKTCNEGYEEKDGKKHPHVRGEDWAKS